MFSENQTDLVELTDKKDSDIEMGEVTSTNNKTHSNSTSHNNNTQNQIEIFLNNINYIVSYFNQNPLMSPKEQSSQLNSNYSSENYSKYLTNAGYKVFNPTSAPLGLTYKEYVDLGLELLMHCDCMCILPYKKNSSSGVMLEKHYAELVGLPIIELKECIWKHIKLDF